MRIGILGGTFDPPHLGHIALARAAIETLQLDEVMFLPVFRNPLKKSKQTGARQRLEMVTTAIESEPNVSVSDIEIQRGGASYAVETLQELTYVQPADYWFLLGSDALKTIGQWKQPEKLLRMCRLGVVLRGMTDRDQLLASVPEYVAPAVDWIQMPPVDISATDLRQRILEGKPVAQWMNPKVLQYVQKNKLYRS